MGPRRGPRTAYGVDVRVVGPADGALRRPGPAADPAAAGVRRRGPLAPAAARPRATTSSTPRRSRTSRCWPRPLVRAAARGYRAGRRLVRGVEPRATGASTSGGSAGALAGSCSALAPRAASARSASRSCTRDRLRDGGPARRDHGARRRLRRTARAPRPRRGRAARGVRRPPHPGEAGARDRAGDRAARASACPGSAAPIFGDGPERERVQRGDRAHGLEGVVEAPGFVATRGGRGRDRAGAVPAAALAARGIRPGRRRGGGAAARRASSSRGPDNAAVELIEDGVNGVRRAVGRPARRSPTAIARVARGRARRCARATRRLVRATTPSGCRSTRSLEIVLASLRRGRAQRRS